MKLSLDTVSYCGYFTDGEYVPLEEAMKRAAKFGYDAVDIFAHRPMGFPMDFDADRIKKIKDLAGELDLEFAVMECCTNYMLSDHVLVFNQEKEILYTKETIKMASDLGMPIVRVLAGFVGYFQNLYSDVGYGNPAFHSRSRRVSQNKDWLEQWHAVKDALIEVCKIAKDHNIILALQTHPEITMNNEETLELIAEVGADNLKVGLDLTLMNSQEDKHVRDTVISMKDYMVHSHSISIIGKATLGGKVYGWDEVVPGVPEDTCNWKVFFETCKEIGYEGYLAYEQCSPIITEGHKIATLDTIDQRNIEQIEFIKPMLKKMDYYTGHKD